MEYRRHSYHPKPRIKRGTNITIPAHASPHVRIVFSEMARQNVTYDEVEQGSGVLRSTLKAWRHRNVPGLTTMEAVLGFLGFDFVPIPREHTVPPEIVAELRPIADRLGIEMSAAVRLTAEIAYRDHHLSARSAPTA